VILSDATLPRALERARGVPPPVVWIASDEPLLGLESADLVRASARAAGFDERSVFHVDRHFRPEVLMQEAGALSLFASRRLLELRLTGKAPKELGESLAESVPRLPDDIRLLVTGPRLDKTAKSAAWFGRVEQAGWLVEIPVVERDRLPRWIGERLQRGGQQADPQTLQLIAERVEGNLLAAKQEVAKLGLLLPQGPLEFEAVRAAVLDVARWDAFDLVDAALSGDVDRAMRCAAGLRAEGAAVPLVLWAIAEAVRTLGRMAGARDAGRPVAPVLAQARVWGDKERIYHAAARRLDAPRLRLLLRACGRADRMTKGVLAGDAWQALEAIALGLAGAASLALACDPALVADAADAG